MLPLQLALIVATAAQPNAHLDQARAEVAALHYDKAEDALRAGLASEGNDRSTLMALLALTGEVKAIVGKNDEATAAFKELLYIAPDAAQSPAWSPKVSGRFADAKAWLAAGAPLTAVAGEPVAAGGKVQALVIVVHDAGLKLAQQVRLNANGTPLTLPVPADGKVVAPVPPGAEVKYWAEVLGPAGATLLALGAPDHPLLARAPADAAVASTAPAADHSALRPYAYGVGGLGAALLGAGTYFALAARSDRSTLSGATRDAQGRITGVSQADAFNLYEEGNSRAAAATFLCASGAAVLAAGVGLWVYSRPVAVVPTPNGVAVAGRWP